MSTNCKHFRMSSGNFLSDTCKTKFVWQNLIRKCFESCSIVVIRYFSLHNVFQLIQLASSNDFLNLDVFQSSLIVSVNSAALMIFVPQSLMQFWPSQTGARLIENYKPCWNDWQQAGYYWVSRGPRVASLFELLPNIFAWTQVWVTSYPPANNSVLFCLVSKSVLFASNNQI